MSFGVLGSRGSERDFKDGPYEGEWQALSICFFFAFIDIQQDKKDKILVFDDPITSLGNSNLDRLVDLIAKKSNNFSQIFILTHHQTFLKFLRKRFSNKTNNQYNLLRNRPLFGGSFLCQIQTGSNFIKKLSNFEHHLQQITQSGIDLELKIIEYGQYLRYEVERFIKYDLLHWDAGSGFGLAIDGLKRNKNIENADLDTIKNIYSFCN